MDLFGKNATRLKEKKLFLFDMDGTIYNENNLFDGVKELLSCILDNGGNYIFITNNSSKSVSEYVERLKKMGIFVTKENFFTSTQATILYLKENYTNEKIYLQGTEAFIKEIGESELNYTTEVEKDVKVVVVGFDTELTSEKLRKTSELLTRKIPFIATNPDLACPVSFGYIPDCGSICQMLTNATQRIPMYIGKPNSQIVELVIKKSSVSKMQTVVVGDRLYTDIASGINANVDTICVLTGETKLDDLKYSKFSPTYTFNSVKDIINEIKK